jgi:5-methylcytosine-specific restriction endonuclease McrA
MKHSTYICKNCGCESKWSRQKFNIYCSNTCKGKAQFKQTIERFKIGQVSDRDTLRKVLTEVKGYKCDSCGISQYNNKPITLQVDHIDGNASNNMPDNLRLICPNCHSQTKTYGGGNKGKGRKSMGLSLR